MVIGGLTQGTDRWNGCLRLWTKLLLFRSPTVSVEFWKWDTRFSDLAERIFLETEGESVRIIVFPFSFGGGWGLPVFARELGKRGLGIEVAVTCDAVYRSKLFIGEWLAFVDWPVIRIPKNVRRVIPFIQRISRPRGHRMVAMDTAATTIDWPTVLYADHTHLDDNKEWHKAAIAVAEAVVAKECS